MNKGSENSIKKVAEAFNHPDPDARHSGAERLRREETESRPCGNSQTRTQSKAFTHPAPDCHSGVADVHNNGVADVLVCQGPEGLSKHKDKLLRSFANGDVCDSPSIAPPSDPNPPIRVIRVIRGQNPTPSPLREIRGQTPTTPPRHHPTPTYPEETRELINSALAKCVERFRFPPEERDKVRRAAELGNPFGQYLWGLVCHYDLGDHLEAWTWFSRSAEHGYHDSVRHQALLMEAGLVPLPGSSRNPATHARQVREAAARLYLKAAELGNYQACFQYGMCCLEGRGALRVFSEAFRWLRLSACQGHIPAQVELARLHLDPHRGYRDPLEAYIWATISAADEVGELLTELDAKLSSEQIFAAQAEALRRSSIIEEKGRLSLEDLEAGVKTVQSTAGQTTRPSPAVQRLKAWKLSDLSQLSFDVNPQAKNVLLSYGKHRLRLSFGEFKQVFAPSALSLLVEHYKACFKNEPPISYDGLNLAYNVRSGSTRKNYLIVSDFNYRIRALFSLPRSERAFEWSSEKNRRLKSLKARVQIKVHF